MRDIFTGGTLSHIPPNNPRLVQPRGPTDGPDRKPDEKPNEPNGIWKGPNGHVEPQCASYRPYNARYERGNEEYRRRLGPEPLECEPGDDEGEFDDAKPVGTQPND